MFSNYFDYFDANSTFFISVFVLHSSCLCYLDILPLKYVLTHASLQR